MACQQGSGSEPIALTGSRQRLMQVVLASPAALVVCFPAVAMLAWWLAGAMLAVIALWFAVAYVIFWRTRLGWGLGGFPTSVWATDEGIRVNTGPEAHTVPWSAVGLVAVGTLYSQSWSEPRPRWWRKPRRAYWWHDQGTGVLVLSSLVVDRRLLAAALDRYGAHMRPMCTEPGPEALPEAEVRVGPASPLGALVVAAVAAGAAFAGVWAMGPNSGGARVAWVDASWAALMAVWVGHVVWWGLGSNVDLGPPGVRVGWTMRPVPWDRAIAQPITASPAVVVCECLRPAGSKLLLVADRRWALWPAEHRPQVPMGTSSGPPPDAPRIRELIPADWWPVWVTGLCMVAGGTALFATLIQPWLLSERAIAVVLAVAAVVACLAIGVDVLRAIASRRAQSR